MRVVHSKTRSAIQIAGKVIAELRKQRGWSQADLAEYARKHSDETLSPKTVTNIEAGTHKPTAGKLIAIADAFDVEVWQLFLPMPEGMDERQTETYFRQLRRMADYFRSAPPNGRESILRIARLESGTKLSEAV